MLLSFKFNTLLSLLLIFILLFNNFNRKFFSCGGQHIFVTNDLLFRFDSFLNYILISLLLTVLVNNFVSFVWIDPLESRNLFIPAKSLPLVCNWRLLQPTAILHSFKLFFFIYGVLVEWLVYDIISLPLVFLIRFRLVPDLIARLSSHGLGALRALEPLVSILKVGI